MYLVTAKTLIQPIYNTTDTPNTTYVKMMEECRQLHGSSSRGPSRYYATFPGSGDSIEYCGSCVTCSHRTSGCSFLSDAKRNLFITQGILPRQEFPQETRFTWVTKIRGAVEYPYPTLSVRETLARSAMEKTSQTRIFERARVPGTVTKPQH